jgi:hypothetical protein
MSGDEPEVDEPALPASTWERVRAGMSSDDGSPMPPGVVAAFRRGLGLVFGQPRKLVTVLVLLLVLLVPVLGVVSTATGAWLSTFVVVALLPVTYARRDGATARVSLLWLGGVAVMCAMLAVPWLGLLLAVLLAPYVAIPAAAWASGSWRRGGRAVARMFRETWLSTIGMCLVVSWVLGIVLGLAFAIWNDGLPLGVGHVLVAVSVVLETTLGIGYALVALARDAAGAPISQP